MKTQQIAVLSLLSLLALSAWGATRGSRSVVERLPQASLQAFGYAISQVGMSPARPAHLTVGEEVKITFHYVAKSRGAVRIFVRPMTGNQLSANYAASGSPLYPAGNGAGSADFTITAGDVTVDGIRFEMQAENGQSVHSQIVPARYRFSRDPFQSATPVPPQRHIRPDGVMEVPQPDGSVSVHEMGKLLLRRVTEGPAGPVKTRSLNIITVAPPVRVEAGDAAWMESLNQWLEAMGQAMLGTIERLAGDPASFENYKQFENDRCQTLYQQVDTRERFLQMLIGGGE
jgi:hypothetical protein